MDALAYLRMSLPGASFDPSTPTFLRSRCDAIYRRLRDDDKESLRIYCEDSLSINEALRSDREFKGLSGYMQWCFDAFVKASAILTPDQTLWRGGLAPVGAAASSWVTKCLVSTTMTQEVATGFSLEPAWPLEDGILVDGREAELRLMQITVGSSVRGVPFSWLMDQNRYFGDREEDEVVLLPGLRWTVIEDAGDVLHVVVDAS